MIARSSTEYFLQGSHFIEQISVTLKVAGSSLMTFNSTGTANAPEDTHEDSLLESEDELESEMPDTTSTQEHQMKFDKNGKMEDEKQVSIQISMP